MTRKNLAIDGALERAIEGLFELYYLYLVEHPALADDVEGIMHSINDCRDDMRWFHNKCWESDPPQFKTIATLNKHVLQARKDTTKKGKKCLGYFHSLAALGKESSSRPYRREERYLKQLDS